MTPEQAFDICLREDKRKPELEPIILTNAFWTFNYIQHVVKSRWPEAEYMVLNNVNFCYWYSINIIKGRWLKAEPVILTDIYSTYLYALYVIKGRWSEAEPIIKQYDYYWEDYCQHFNIKAKCNWKIGL